MGKLFKLRFNAIPTSQTLINGLLIIIIHVERSDESSGWWWLLVNCRLTIGSFILRNVTYDISVSDINLNMMLLSDCYSTPTTALLMTCIIYSKSSSAYHRLYTMLSSSKSHLPSRNRLRRIYIPKTAAQRRAAKQNCEHVKKSIDKSITLGSSHASNNVGSSDGSNVGR